MHSGIIPDSVVQLSAQANKVRQHFRNGFEGANVNESPISDFLDAVVAVRASQPRRSAQGPTKADVSSFERWLQLHEISLKDRGLSIARVSEGLGLSALRPFAEGEPVLTVPLSIMLTTKRAAAHTHIEELMKRDSVMLSIPTVLLALYLVSEVHLGDESFFGPYIKILPDTFDSPLFWGAEELRRLNGSPLLGDAIKLQVTTALQYSFLCTIIQNTGDKIVSMAKFSFDEFLWAMGVVLSRQNVVPIDGKNELALVPLWDLLNHVDGKITSFFDPAKGELDCLALRNFAEGEQIYMAYGSRPNSELLLFQGFIDPENPHDCLDVFPRVPESDPLHAEKVAFLDQHVKASAHSLYIFRNGTLSPDLASFLRVVVADATEWARIDRSKWPVSDEISTRNELALCEWTIAFLQSLERAYPAIEAPAAESNAHTLAAGLVAAEKRTIAAVIAALTEAQQRLNKRKKQLDKKKKQKAKKKATAKASAAAPAAAAESSASSEATAQ